MQLAAKAVRMRAHLLAGLIGLTALSGAFVAGMDAGHAYNECASPQPTTPAARPRRRFCVRVLGAFLSPMLTRRLGFGFAWIAGSL